MSIVTSLRPLLRKQSDESESENGENKAIKSNDDCCHLAAPIIEKTARKMFQAVKRPRSWNGLRSAMYACTKTCIHTCLHRKYIKIHVWFSLRRYAIIRIPRRLWVAVLDSAAVKMNQVRLSVRYFLSFSLISFYFPLLSFPFLSFPFLIFPFLSPFLSSLQIGSLLYCVINAYVFPL